MVPSISNKIAQAAFRDVRTGKVHPTGNFHDLNKLPSNIDIDNLEDGFVTHNNQFVTRKEATLLLNLNRPVQSEELALTELSSEGYSFVGPTLENAHYTVKAFHQDKPVGNFTFWAKPVTDKTHQHFGYHRVGGTEVSLQHRGKGVNSQMMRIASKFIKTKLGGKGLVSEGPWREDAATRSWEGMSRRYKGVKTLPNKDEPDTVDFRLSEDENIDLVKNENTHEFKVRFKQWLRTHFLDKSLKWECDAIGDDDLEIGANMSGFAVENTKEYKAAKFMAHNEEPEPELLREATITYDNDFEFAMLMAFNLDRTEKNREILRSLINLGELTKSEQQNVVTPSKVERVLPEGEKLSRVIQRAFNYGHVKLIKLNGKHSKGTAVAWDHKGSAKYLLKPGSGPLSPAAGVRQELANQSRREVCFSRLSSAMHMAEFVPHAELLNIDGKEVACMRLLTGTYVSSDKRKGQIELMQALRDYLDDGTIYKWAIMDFVMGNADRHSGNMMVNDEGTVKLIDHGSAFSGTLYDPANDSKSFVPFYLRCWTGNKFKILPPQDRYESIPKPTSDIAKKVSVWFDSLDFEKIKGILEDYQINVIPVMQRLNKIRGLGTEDRVDWVLKFFAGVKNED